MMSDRTIVLLALIALVVPVLNWLTTRRAIKAAEMAAAKAEETAKKLDVVHSQINGMKDELVRATGAEKLAEGEAAGRQKAIDETAERLAIRERGEDRAAAGTVAVPDHPTDLQSIIAEAVAKAIHDSGGYPKAEAPPKQLDRIENNTEDIKTQLK